MQAHHGTPAPSPPIEPNNSQYTLSSLPAERMVLGGIVEDPTLLTDVIASGLMPGDFSLSDHRRIFAAILALAKVNSPFDYVLVAEHLGGSQNEYVLVGSVLEGVVVERDHILHYVALVRKKSRLRQLERLGACLVSSAGEQGANPETIAELFREKLQNVVSAGLEAPHV
jgi:replicative DNA helicase